MSDIEPADSPAPRTFIVGTRGSRLALRQTERVLEALRAVNPEVRFEVRTIRTEGDRSTAPLASFPGRGIFATEIEYALLDGEIDLAIHSLKDLANEETPGLIVAATPRRVDPSDALISRNGALFADLAPGATIGTGSPRRAAQVLALRPDLRVADIRGNVDTRIRKMDAGDYDAIIVAAAGLARLGWLERATQLFLPNEMLPAAGQGALAVQVRAVDDDAITLARTIDDLDTNVCVFAERTFEAPARRRLPRRDRGPGRDRRHHPAPQRPRRRPAGRTCLPRTGRRSNDGRRGPGAGACREADRLRRHRSTRGVARVEAPGRMGSSRSSAQAPGIPASSPSRALSAYAKRTSSSTTGWSACVCWTTRARTLS